ncbi:MAG: hypothetical protein EOP57_01130 [Sphingomonadales bacterium]|nr:MAG: hypothetical protein EOP57_01130 [Sphingomonadales bacterium]
MIRALLTSCASLAVVLASPAVPQEREPSAGPLCVYAIVNVAAEVGRRCATLHDAVVQSALDKSVATLDAWVLREGWTQAEMIAFKREQAHIGDPNPDVDLCTGDAAMFYPKRSYIPQLETITARVAATTGPPQWGDCL